MQLLGIRIQLRKIQARLPRTAEEVSAETEEAVTEAAAEAESSAEAETSADTNASEETAAPEETSERGALVAYFSWSGNTEQMAQIIAEETGSGSV